MIAGFDFRNCSLEGLRDVLEWFAGRLNVIWDKEHKDDGSHGHVTADSVTADELHATERLLVSPYDLDTLDLTEPTDTRQYLAITSDDTATDDNSMRIQARSKGNIAVRTSYLVPRITVAANATGERIQATLTKPGSGVNPAFATLELLGPTIGGSGATVLVGAALYVPAAGTGATTNYGIFVAPGVISQFDEVQVTGDILPDFANSNDIGSASLAFAKTFGGAWIGRVVAPAALAASQNNYSPTGLSTAYVLALSATGPINITGLDATGFEDGRPLIVANVGAPIITLTHEDGASTATNRWFFYDAANRAMGNGRSVMMHRNPSLNNRWVLVGA